MAPIVTRLEHCEETMGLQSEFVVHGASQRRAETRRLSLGSFELVEIAGLGQGGDNSKINQAKRTVRKSLLAV